jgi:hypothetical protein
VKLARSVSAIAVVGSLMMAESSKASNGCETISQERSIDPMEIRQTREANGNGESKLA